MTVKIAKIVHGLLQPVLSIGRKIEGKQVWALDLLYGWTDSREIWGVTYRQHDEQFAGILEATIITSKTEQKSWDAKIPRIVGRDAEGSLSSSGRERQLESSARWKGHVEQEF